MSIANDEKIVANANYFDLSAGDFSQDWLNEGLITANDDWSNVPSIVGFLGQDLTSSSGVDPQTVTGVSTFSNDIDVMANQTNPNTLTAGGVAEFDGLTNKVVALQGSGTADAPYILIHLNSLNRQNLNVSYVLRDVDGSSDNAMQPVALQYRVGETGNFTNVPEAFVSDATEGPSLSGKETNVSVQLPAAVNNSAKVQLRIITTNAPSSDEWVGIDNIQVTSSPFATTNPGTLQFSSTSYSASENAGTALVTVTRSGGTDGAVSVNFSAQNGTATGGSTCSTNVDFLTTSGNLNWANGEGGSKTFNVTL
ncbi:MAG TPA: Calx-beta domain-containing protein, partial [Pyrinomonadaceae bacterium]|nr:Calx-beta domain-containing protein [Pyrinomonadaceae bacterium]